MPDDFTRLGESAELTHAETPRVKQFKICKHLQIINKFITV